MFRRRRRGDKGGSSSASRCVKGWRLTFSLDTSYLHAQLIRLEVGAVGLLDPGMQSGNEYLCCATTGRGRIWLIWLIGSPLCLGSWGHYFSLRNNKLHGSLLPNPVLST